jgi:adenylosuccinate lyase
MRSFHEHRDFKALLLEDADVTGVLGAGDIDRAFDLQEQLRHVDHVFERVFQEVAV